MPTQVNTILRSSHRGGSLNILCAATHERYQSNLAQLPYTFWSWQGQNIKPWNREYGELPHNYILLNPELGNQQIPLNVDIDLVLSQNKFGQFQVMKAIATQLGCPLISLEHTLPPDNWTNSQLVPHKEMAGDVNVFISEYSMGKWGWGAGEGNAQVIHHGVDTEVFKPDDSIEREPIVCSVVNDWINREWCCHFSLWQKVTDYPNSKWKLNVWGNTPGLSKSTDGVAHLVKELNRSSVFLNTSKISPIPYSVLEAMACEIPVVSAATCMIPEIIQNGVNGFISNDPATLRGYVDKLLSDKELSLQIGRAARKTILEKFSMSNFLEKWNNLFWSVL